MQGLDSGRSTCRVGFRGARTQLRFGVKGVERARRLSSGRPAITRGKNPISSRAVMF